eukprot:Rmarinus@m.4864
MYLVPSCQVLFPPEYRILLTSNKFDSTSTSWTVKFQTVWPSLLFLKSLILMTTSFLVLYRSSTYARASRSFRFKTITSKARSPTLKTWITLSCLICPTISSTVLCRRLPTVTSLLSFCWRTTP